MKTAGNNPETEAFDNHVQAYDRWFDEHPVLFESEIRALDRAAPHSEYALEVGAGTGRFARECGIDWGIEPSPKMAKVAEQRGTNTLIAKAENIPFLDNTFGYVLMVTVDCFLENPEQAYREIRRVLKPGGILVNGMIDRNSELGRRYEKRKNQSLFYRHAEFRSPDKITKILEQVGFEEFQYWQTLITASEEEPEEPIPGYGRGGFVVIKATARK